MTNGKKKAAEAIRVLTMMELDILKELPVKSLKRYCTQAGLSVLGR